MLVEAVTARIDEEVATLSKRVKGAAEFAELTKRGELPQATPAAFVVPLGLRGGAADASANVFTQMVSEIVAVILVVSAAGDASGARALPKIDTLIKDVIAAVCGYAPNDEIGAFQLDSGQMFGVVEGAIFYQLNFSILDQVRITT